MEKCPLLKFTISIDRDIGTYKGFIETAKIFDIEKSLAIGFYNLYPGLKKIAEDKNNQKQKDKLIKKFVKKIYQRDLTKINRAMSETKKQWQKIKKLFFKEISILFKNHPWPKGKYFVYPTIWGIYPRFLNDKTFLFPYKSKTKGFKLLVIMHEMLHFIFYDYAIKKHSKIFRKLDTERGVFWDLAEVFNIVILSSPKFVKLHGQKNMFCHSKHKKYLPKLKKLWQETKNLDEWLIKGCEYLRRT